MEPQLSLGEMETLDLIADQIEVQRLQKMEVAQREDELPSGLELGSPLAAKMVRTWRQKEREVDGIADPDWLLENTFFWKSELPAAPCFRVCCQF